MAHHKSALKRIKQNEKRRLRNKAVITRVRTVTKSVRAAVEQGEDNVDQLLVQAIATIDKAASKGSIPKRRASRKIGRLTKLVNRSHA